MEQENQAGEHFGLLVVDLDLPDIDVASTRKHPWTSLMLLLSASSSVAYRVFSGAEDDR